MTVDLTFARYWRKLGKLRDRHMLCDVCDERFAEGEAMVRIPAIGWMHQNCKSPFGEMIRKIREAETLEDDYFAEKEWKVAHDEE